jgi:hypothetical protein
MSFSVLAGKSIYKKALTERYYRNSEDWSLLMYAVVHGIKFKLVREKLVNYRIHEKSIMVSFNDKSLKPTKVQVALNKEIIDTLEHNLRIAPSLSSKYGTFLQILRLKCTNDYLLGIIKLLKIFNIKFILYRLISKIIK